MAENHNVHEGHRKHMLEKFSKHGIDIFSEHEKLEILLYLIIPRKNTNTIAHNLINRFESISSALSAPRDELRKIDGIGTNASLNLNFIGALLNHLFKTPVPTNKNLVSADEAMEYCKEYFNKKTKETFSLLLLDDKCTLLQTYDICDNQPNHISLSLREIIKQVMEYDSHKVIISHNHTNGTASPSDDDVRQTREIGEYLKRIDVGLVDHIIVSNSNAISLRNQGIMNDVWAL